MKSKTTYCSVITRIIITFSMAIACLLLSTESIQASGGAGGITIHHSDDCSKEDTFKETYIMGQGHSVILSGMEHTFTATIDEELKDECDGLPFKWRVEERDSNTNKVSLISQINGKMYEGESFSFTAKSGCTYSFYVSVSNGNSVTAGTYTANTYDKELADVVEEPKVDIKPDLIAKKITNVTMTGISTKITAGKSIQLTTTVLPKNATNKKLKWTSSNTKVATVSQTGKVSIKKGTGGKSVTIIATATDGSGKKAVFNIKVMKGAVKSIKINGAKKVLKVGKTMKLKAVVKATKRKPVNKNVKWASSNNRYATVSSKGIVKAQKAGKGKKVKITAMATDGTGKKKVVTIRIR